MLLQCLQNKRPLILHLYSSGEQLLVVLLVNLFVVDVFFGGELPVDTHKPPESWRIESLFNGGKAHLKSIGIEGADLLDQFCQLCHGIGEELTLCGTDPTNGNSVPAYPGQFEELLHNFDSLCGIVITFQVMAFSKVSAKNQHAVKAAPQTLNDVQRVDAPGT